MAHEPRPSSVIIPDEQRDVMRRHALKRGECCAAEQAGVSRTAYLRAMGGLSVRRGTARILDDWFRELGVTTTA